MTSFKPDKVRIKNAARSRHEHWIPDFFEDVEKAIKAAIDGGIITQSRAIELAQFLDGLPLLDFFPYSALKRVLATAIKHGCWSENIDRDLLIFLSYLFTDLGRYSPISDLANENLPIFGDIYSLLFDEAPTSFSVSGLLCDFTGKFRFGSRRDCYALIDDLGGIPCDAPYYTDCIFIADEYIDSKTVSNGVSAACVMRMHHGRPRIYKESDFERLAKQT